MNILDFNEIALSPYTKLIISKKSSLHKHTFFEFAICIDGELENTINGKTYHIEKGTIVLLRPEDSHIFHATKRHVSRDIYVSPQTMKAVCDVINENLYNTLNNKPLSVFFNISNYDLQSLENKLNFFNKNNDMPESILRTAHLNVITDILNLWQQSKFSKLYLDCPNWISKLIIDINTESFITKSVDEIVASTNYSHGYVCREFKKYTGSTLNEYITTAKFSYALALLQDPQNSITSIAEKLNYSSTSNFIISFRNKFSLSPSQYRKQKTFQNN